MKTEKQMQILDCALKVFTRYGLRKTSIDDIAKAADISRQGVYLHFKSKEEIFKAAILKFLSERSQAASEVLQNQDWPLSKRLLGAMDEWFGHNVGLIHQDASDTIEQGILVLGDALKEANEAFRSNLTKTITSSTKVGKKMASDITGILCACGMTWKHEVASREEFLEKMKVAIQICSKNLE